MNINDHARGNGDFDQDEAPLTESDWQSSWDEACAVCDIGRMQNLLIESMLLDGGRSGAYDRRFMRNIAPCLRRDDFVAHPALSGLLVTLSGMDDDLSDKSRDFLMEFCRRSYRQMADPAARAWAESHIRDRRLPEHALDVLLGMLADAPADFEGEVLFGIAIAAKKVSARLGAELIAMIRGRGDTSNAALAAQMRSTWRSGAGWPQAN